MVQFRQPRPGSVGHRVEEPQQPQLGRVTGKLGPDVVLLRSQQVIGRPAVHRVRFDLRAQSPQRRRSLRPHLLRVFHGEPHPVVPLHEQVAGLVLNLVVRVAHHQLPERPGGPVVSQVAQQAPHTREVKPDVLEPVQDPLVHLAVV